VNARALLTAKRPARAEPPARCGAGPAAIPRLTPAAAVRHSWPCPASASRSTARTSP